MIQMRQLLPVWLVVVVLSGCSGGDGGDVDQCQRWILKDDVTNARDLGGHALQPQGRVACGEIFRGGQLSALSDGDCLEFSEIGVKTVIDLRMEDTQQSSPPASCVQQQVTLVDAAMPKLLPDTPENYLALLDQKQAVANVFGVLGDAGSYPVYFHCVIGRDRASFVAALILMALGANDETVMDEFELSAKADVAVKPECIQAVLDEVQGQGGIVAYLHSAAVTDGQLDVLRKQACVD